MELEGIRGIMDWEFFGRSGGRKPFKRFSPPPPTLTNALSITAVQNANT